MLIISEGVLYILLIIDTSFGKCIYLNVSRLMPPFLAGIMMAGILAATIIHRTLIF